jgi:hypothetical protein
MIPPNALRPPEGIEHIMYMRAHYDEVSIEHLTKGKTYTPRSRLTQAFPNLIPLPRRVLGSRIVLSESLDGDGTVIAVSKELGGCWMVRQ